MVVQHNLSAANTARQLKTVTGKQTKSAEKLSSGYRINRAADDAAGLSISEKMRWQIRGLDQGTSNAQDGVSVCQVADGALAEVSEMLHRITELSVQASNDTNTDSDRQAIQKEIHELLQEIDRIGDTTEYNTQPLFHGGNVTATGGTTAGSSPVKVNTVSGLSDFGDINRFNMLESSFWLSASGDSVTLRSDMAPGAYYNPKTAVTTTWKDAGLTVIDDTVKAGIYRLKIGDSSSLYTEMVVNVEKDISLSEFNQAMDGGKLGHTYTFGENGTGFGNIDGAGTSYLQIGDAVKFIRDMNLDWGNPPKDSFDVVLHRDADGKIYGELPNGVRLTEAEKPVNSDREVLQIGRWGNGDEPYYSLKLYFDDSQYDLDSVRSGVTVSIGDRPGGGRKVKLTSFTPAATSGADSLTAPKQWWIQSGERNGNGMFLTIDKMNTRQLGIYGADVSTRDGAQKALTQAQTALERVSKSRSSIGAQQNRLEHTIRNDENMAENAQTAESRIRDTDMASEMVENATANILRQVGESILTQNNQSKNHVLELLTQ